ncbi:hypothetical protein AGMMS4952_14990 [Spirochaetia bacterium]|nr:hypothetical protein AGMMS4952_14990 [Spirochaetia bacterium]
MWELGVLELLIALFLFLPLIRPFVKRLWPMDGLAVLPLLALLIVIGLSPAYGIRPECIPLILYVIILNIANLPALGAVFRRLKNDNFRDRGPFSTGFLLGLLIAATVLAIYFVPSLDIHMADSGVRTHIAQDTGRNRNGRPVRLFLRIYQPDKEKSALLVLVPPAAGSLMTINNLCGELSRRGFTVLTYSRKGIDFPAIGERGQKLSLSPARAIRLLRIIFQGTEWATANTLGRALEEERKQDLIFLLNSLKNRGSMGNLLNENTDRDHIFIAGYGAGGAAAVSLAASPGFAAAHPAVQGIIGLECPILSSMEQEKVKTVGISREEAGWLRFFLANLSNRIANLGPRKVKGIETPPLPEVPAFFILSDRALYARRRENGYMSVQMSFQMSASPAALAMVPGAGPLDYSDVPEKYPLLSRLFSGDATPVWAREDYLDGTASLIINFAAALSQTIPGTGDTAPVFERTVLNRNISIDTNKAWNLTAPGYILGL